MYLKEKKLFWGQSVSLIIQTNKESKTGKNFILKKKLIKFSKDVRV